MARELQLARRVHGEGGIPPVTELAIGGTGQDQTQNLSLCEHRKVSKAGRIICAQIAAEYCLVVNHIPLQSIALPWSKSSIEGHS